MKLIEEEPWPYNLTHSELRTRSQKLRDACRSLRKRFNNMKLICGFSLLAFGAIIVALVIANASLSVTAEAWKRCYGDMHDRAAAVSKKFDSIPPDPLPIYINPIRGEIRGVLASRHR